MATLEVLTIGHSNHTIERFIELLCQHRVTVKGFISFAAPRGRRADEA